MSKVLCFTVSYNRPYYIYNTINNILNQSYKDFEYSVRINIDQNNDKLMYEKLLQDFKDDNRLKISYGHNLSQQKNYINSINSLYNDHDILIKIDDDDIYHKNYLQTGIKLFNELDTDILSFNSFIHINNRKLYNKMESIGWWKGDKDQEINFGMPPTYFFNKRAFDLIKDLTDDEVKKIHLFEDGAWRVAWRNNNLRSIIMDNEIFTYHIHGNNISSKFLYDGDQNNSFYIDNEYCLIYKFKHPDWSSYVYLNKRNNRAYNIKNDDHGGFKRIDHATIEIKWDNWGKEKFIRVHSGNYYEKVN